MASNSVMTWGEAVDFTFVALVALSLCYKY